MILTFGSLFAGIGGFDLGLERAGITCSWQVEIDDHATKILEKHWPDVTRFRDVRSVGSHNLAPVDVICGGFPCQDVAPAGTRHGLDGTRSGLWAEFARTVRELRPGYVIVENSAALAYRGLSRVLGDLAAIGYDAEWEVIPACAFGAPHTRERMFIVAYPASIGLERRVFPETPWQIPPAFTVSYGATRACWPDAPQMERVGYGVSDWVQRLKSIGNAVVPQVAEYVGRCVVAHAERMECAA